MTTWRFLLKFILNLQVDEPHYIRITEHPVRDESNTAVAPMFEPTKFEKVQVAITNCKCGEHEYMNTRIESMNCGERPPQMRTSMQHPNTSALSMHNEYFPPVYVENGTETDNSQFPWVVALIHRTKNGSAVHFCGGALISSKLVLTATHCFNKYSINNTEVWLNEKNLLLSTSADDRPTIKINAKRLIVHPMYNPIWNYNDIALVELTEAVDIQKSTLRPICLPFNEDYEKFHFAYTAGWGRLSYEGKKSDKLLHVCLPLLTHNDCTTKTVPHYNTSVTEWMLCAGDLKNGQRDACPGDSGGPLFVEGGSEKSRYFIIGIVSWGDRCGLPRRPGVYTRVTKYLPWINHEAMKIPDNKLCGTNTN